MLDFLKNYVMKNVWCTPDQDYQFIFQPARITAERGSVRTVLVANETFNLPTLNDRFHVFQIGQSTPGMYNLFTERNIWIPVSQICRNRKMVIDLYSDNGLQFPRFKVWMMITYNRNMLIAVQHIPNYPLQIPRDNFYMRVYSNAYFGSDEDVADGHADEVVVSSRVIASSNDQITAINQFNSYSSRAYGHTYGFVNGYYVTRFYAGTVKIGDYVEMIYDSTIHKVFDVQATSLEDFLSELDGVYKYLLNTGQVLGDNIEYRDDLDFWLIKPGAANSARGVYYHKNQENAVRMITNQDYSIPVDYVMSYVTNSELFNSVNDMTLRVHFRRSGYKRPLINEHHRIKELYKLPYNDVRNAMLGYDSGVDVWRVENLEKSDYPRIMRSYPQFITNAMSVNAMGYNAISKVVADSPIQTVNDYGITIARLPVGLQHKSHVFEYDVNGHLLGHYNHNLVDYYSCRHPQTKFIEATRNNASHSTGAIWNGQNIDIDPALNYRFYVSPQSGGIPSNEWENVTGTDYYTIANNKVIWGSKAAGYTTMIRHDGHNLIYSFETPAVDGMLSFSITSMESITGGEPEELVVHIPPAIVELWVNGKALVKDVDYCIQYPVVLIYAKDHWNQDGNQRVTVRCSGLPRDTFDLEEPVDVGYVQYGIISRNNRFNIRDDKVSRVVAGGRVLLPSQTKFQENTTTSSNADPLNGKPYMVMDYYVPLHDFIDRETQPFREASRVVDGNISDYLTVKLPEPTDPPAIPSLLDDLYNVFSPFLAQLTFNLKDGSIDNSRIEGNYTDMEVMAIMSPYENVLPFDPTRQELNMSVVAIHPHHKPTRVSVTQDQYRFLNRVIALYFDISFDMSKFYIIE